MAQKISVDPKLLPELSAFYKTQHADMLQVKSYIARNCSLDGDMGLLLGALHPLYTWVSGKGTDAMQKVADLLTALSEQVMAYEKDVEEQEAAVKRTVATLHSQLNSVTTPRHAAPGGGGGAGEGAVSGSSATPAKPAAGSAPVSGPPVDPKTSAVGAVPVSTAPPVSTTPPASTAPVTPPETITITAEPGTTVTVVEGPTGVTITASPTSADTAVATENAREAAYYQQFWKDQSAADPLGRTPAQLEAAWEAREPVQPGTTAGVGYAAPTQPTAVPVSFALPSPSPAPLIGAGVSR